MKISTNQCGSTLPVFTRTFSVWYVVFSIRYPSHWLFRTPEYCWLTWSTHLEYNAPTGPSCTFLLDMAVVWPCIPCKLSSTIPACRQTIRVRERERLDDNISRCNTVSQDYPQEGLVKIKARFNIPAGEEITTSYMRPTQDTQSRRQLLAHTWHFWCSCSRSVLKQIIQILEYFYLNCE